MTQKKRTRSDYRTVQEGTIAHYLLYEYPLGLDYTRGASGSLKIHDTRRDLGGRFLHQDESGRVDLDHRFLNQLAGVPRERFRDAIEDLREMDGLSIPGRDLVAALEWHQNATFNKAKGHTTQSLALKLGVDRRSIARWRDEAIRLVTVLVFQGQQVG